MAISNRRQVTLGEIFDAQAFALRGSIYKIMTGIVTAYHPGTKGKSPATVDVQPGIADVRLDTTSGAITFEPWPVLPNVPLGMPQGGGYGFAFRMKKGDSVTLLSPDLDPTPYEASGNASNPVDTRRHGGNYWRALPFDFTDPNALDDPGANLVVTVPGGGAVLVGADASDFVALDSKVKSALTNLANWVLTGSGSGYIPPSAPYVPDDVGATELKAK